MRKQYDTTCCVITSSYALNTSVMVMQTSTGRQPACKNAIHMYYDSGRNLALGIGPISSKGCVRVLAIYYASCFVLPHLQLC